MTSLHMPIRAARERLPKSATFEEVYEAESQPIKATQPKREPEAVWTPVTALKTPAIQVYHPVADLLDLAFERRCFICHRRGRCSHREPLVELALIGAGIETQVKGTTA